MRAPKENARTISKTQATLLYENSAFLAAGAIAAVTRIAKTGKTGIDSDAVRRRHPVASLDEAAIAQLVEHVIRNDGVGSSNLSCGTNRR